MKIGLLECDHVAEQFRHIAGNYRDMFQALFPAVDFEFFDLCNGHFPDSVQRCDAFVCTGSKYSVYEKIDWILRLKAFVRELYTWQKGFLGICLGHQMLAEALGGKVQKSSVGWCVGVHSFDIIQKENWMQPFQQSVNLLMLCQDQVHVLPDNSKVLAATADCPMGMFRVGEKMLGIQAHPEFPKEYDKAIFSERLRRIGPQKVKSGMESLDLPVDATIVGEWIMNFLRNP